MFSSLAAGTTFTLASRARGSATLLEAWGTGAPQSSALLTVIVLAVIGLSAVALDAFEIISSCTYGIGDVHWPTVFSTKIRLPLVSES